MQHTTLSIGNPAVHISLPETTDLQTTLNDIAANVSRTVNLLEEISRKLTPARPVYVSRQEGTNYDEQARALLKALDWEK